MSTEKIIELNRDNFCLKASIDGNGPVAIVIGRHKYYPRTFSENLKSKLQLVLPIHKALFLHLRITRKMTLQSINSSRILKA